MSRKLYLKPWDYNKSVLIDKLEQWVVENGGELLGYYRPGTIIRSDHNGHTFGSTETKHCDVFGTYTMFILNGEYYYVELNDNPFFDFLYNRIKVENGKWKGQYCSDVLPKEWLYDCMFSHTITEEEMAEVFDAFKDTLFSMSPSKRYYEHKRKRVRNIYDNGYHYESVDVSDNSWHSPTPRKEMIF